MKKVINYRPIFFIAVALILGGYSFVSFYKYDWASFVVLGLVIALLGVCGYISIKKKSKQFMIRTVCLFILPFIIGGLVVTNLVDKKLEYTAPSGEYLIKGQVASGGVDEEGAIKAVLKDVTLVSLDENNEGEDETKLSGQVYFIGSAFYDERFYVGDTITFYGKYIYIYDDVKTDPLSADMEIAQVFNSSNIIIEEGSGVKYTILKWSKNTLYKYMDSSNADVAYAMLFGEKLTMDSQLKTTYNITGLAHILAVSGLHVGFIILLFGYLLKKLIKNNWVYSILLMSILIFYAYLCNWSPSIIRAVVMCGVTLFSASLFIQYDGLNALSIAGIVNFIISPLNIFDIGFLLSFFVVFSILSIAPQIRFILKNKMPKKLASSLAVTSSAWLGGMPIIIYYFESLTPYSIVINLIVVPFVSTIFLTTAICLGVSAIFNVGSFFLNISEFMINCLNTVVEGFSVLDGSLLTISCSYPILILGICALIIAGDYTFIKKRWLYAYTLAFGFLCCALVYSFS